jgi:prepilin-type N-terminal cleavage/methylation domain-containing protein
VARSPETALIAPNSKTCYISSMKRNFPFSGARRHRSGFSLIELLVVMTIIMILSGIVIGALIKVNKQRDIKQTRVTLRNLALKLEEYASEHNGIYPVGEDASSSILFNALSGDYTGQGRLLRDQFTGKNSTTKRMPPLWEPCRGRRSFLIVLVSHSAIVRRSTRTEIWLKKSKMMGILTFGPSGLIMNPLT